MQANGGCFLSWPDNEDLRKTANDGYTGRRAENVNGSWNSLQLGGSFIQADAEAHDEAMGWVQTQTFKHLRVWSLHMAKENIVQNL